MTDASSPQRRLVLATRNAHKVTEVQRVLGPIGFRVEPLPDGVELPPEVGDTFAENALPKARTAAAALGTPAIADDSGIEAEALGGAPGVRSARYAGEDASDEANLDKLMREAPVGSPLRYVCAMAYVEPGTGEEHLFFGDCKGRMSGEQRGSRGFGYDPAFIPNEGDGRTMAELDEDEKDRISHRGHALRALAAWLGRAAP
jgi:XTP/dITP diphosphohydrolase